MILRKSSHLSIKVRTDATHFVWNTNDFNFKSKNEWVNRNIGIVMDVVVVARVGSFKYLGHFNQRWKNSCLATTRDSFTVLRERILAIHKHSAEFYPCMCVSITKQQNCMIILVNLIEKRRTTALWKGCIMCNKH